VSPVRYELGFYIPEDGILHIRRGPKTTIIVLATSIINLLDWIVFESIWK
jgi:hypothetical protein